MGETMKTLPELFREAQTISPDFAKVSWFVDYDDDCPEVWRVGRQCVSVEDASTIIVGACVAMLEWWSWFKQTDQTYEASYDGPEDERHKCDPITGAPTLAQALLLAVLAQHERSGT